MLNAFLGFSCVPRGQVSLSCPLDPCPPLPISISPSPLLLTCFLLFLHHSTPMYIYQRRFHTHPASLFCFILALSPYPHFAFFGIFYGCSPATSTIPHPYILTSIVFPCHLTPCLAHPIPHPLPVPPTPHFAFCYFIWLFLF